MGGGRMRDRRLAAWSITKYHHYLKIQEEDEIAREWALTIMINGEQYATVVCTPDNVEELVIGFLASEGIIRNCSAMKQLTIDESKGFAYVELTKSISLDKRTERWIGSCCGKSREFYLKQDVQIAKTIYSNIKLSIHHVYDLMKAFDKEADIFGRTGGVHQAALATKSELIASFIDIGRHNALDKLYGYVLKNRISLKDTCILFSGRISSEVILKVSKMGIGIVLAKSAPTDLALKLADDLQITAIGFVRNDTLNVYTHGYRVYEGDIEHDVHDL